MEQQSKVCLVHGSRSPMAMQLTYELAKSGWSVFAAWDGRSPGPRATPRDAPRLGAQQRRSMEKVLFRLKQDQEDLGDEHVLRTVSSSLTEADSAASHQGLDLILHVCAERIAPSADSDDEILMAMEEGAMETRKSLRFVKAVHPLIQATAAALVFLLPPSEVADSGCMRAAAHKTSRIVDQNPLRHADGTPCSFALHPQQQCPETNVRLIVAWLLETLNTPRLEWSAIAGRVVPLCG